MQIGDGGNVLIHHAREQKHRKYSTVSVSVFRGRISWHFSLSKNNISPAASDLELISHIVSTWILTNYECTHKATTRQSVSNRFYRQSKIRPPICAPFGTKSLSNKFRFFSFKNKSIKKKYISQIRNALIKMSGFVRVPT